MVNQQEALVEFLDDLLAEDVHEETPGAVELSVETEETTPITIEAEAEMEISEMVEPAVETKEENVEPSPVEIIDPAGRKLMVPAWGLQPFQAMVFKVRDLSLALPIQALSGVLDWQTAQVEQQAGSMLLLGQTKHLGKAVNVVDTARFIFPEERLTEQNFRDNSPGLSRIILINQGKIGLACDEVYELIDIHPEKVTWRSEKTRRKWLAGTMLEEMIVLLDAETLADILVSELGLKTGH